MKHIYTFVFVFAFLLSGNNSVLAQVEPLYSVFGVLLDQTTNQPVPFVNIGLLRQADSIFVRGASSDEKGNFEIRNVASGNYLLRVSAIGYSNFMRPIEVRENVKLGILRLAQGATVLDAVVIKEKKPLYANEGEKTMYQVSEDPSVQSGTASDALQNAPGVEVDIEGNITLRGVSSVDIWINDKPSNLSAENLKTYIQQLPANSIERIEVITNPSARYASKSDGGIINIVTNAKVKKNQFISFGAYATSRPAVTPWISYVWSNEKINLNFYGNFLYSIWDSKRENYNYSFNNLGDTSQYQHSNSKDKSKTISGYFHFSFDYTMDTMNTFSFWMGMGPNAQRSNNESTTFRKEYLYMIGDYTYNASGGNSSDYLWGYGGAWYEHKFNSKGHKISAGLDGNLFMNTNASNYQRSYIPQAWLDLTQKSSQKQSENGWSANIDYTIPYSKNGEISVGLSNQWGWENNDYKKDTLIKNTEDTYIRDSLRSYRSQFLDRIFDAYITLQHRFGDFTIKLGSRIEYANLDAVYPDATQYNFEKSYTNWRPSIHLSYRTKDMHNFKLSYSRRISNPSVGQLTRFVVYDLDSYTIGNPNLEPTYTNSFEGGWSKYIDKFGSINLSAYYRNSTNSINSLTDVAYSDVYGRIVSFTQDVNLGSSYNTGAELNVTYRPQDFMNIRFYANIYESYLETYFRKDEKVESNMFSYSFRLNFWAKLWKKFEIYASANYRSPTQSLFAEKKATYSVDCGLRADFYDRKFSVFLNVQDIFDWNKSENITTNPYYISYNSFKYTSRYISAGITCRFGKMELESQAKQNATQGNGASM